MSKWFFLAFEFDYIVILCYTLMQCSLLLLEKDQVFFPHFIASAILTFSDSSSYMLKASMLGKFNTHLIKRDFFAMGHRVANHYKHIFIGFKNPVAFQKVLFIISREIVNHLGRMPFASSKFCI